MLGVRAGGHECWVCMLVVVKRTRRMLQWAVRLSTSFAGVCYVFCKRGEGGGYVVLKCQAPLQAVMQGVSTSCCV